VSIAEPFDKKLLDKATIVPTGTEVINFEKQVESLFHRLFESHELSEYQEQWMIEQQIQYNRWGICNISIFVDWKS